MKTVIISKFLTYLFTSILLVSCKKEEKKLIFQTNNIKVENIQFQLPNNFEEISENTWMYNIDRKIGKIEISKRDGDNLEDAFQDLKNQKMEKEFNKYTLIETKKGDTLDKKYILETYKYNNSNYIGGYQVYSYETFSVVKANKNIINLYSFSLGFNLNDTMKQSILNIKK